MWTASTTPRATSAKGRARASLTADWPSYVGILQMQAWIRRRRPPRHPARLPAGRHPPAMPVQQPLAERLRLVRKMPGRLLRRHSRYLRRKSLHFSSASTAPKERTANDARRASTGMRPRARPTTAPPVPARKC